MNNLIKNIDKLHTTPLGIERIKNNLQIETDDIVKYCKLLILDKNAEIKRIGKNFYVTLNKNKITINANSYTIITAHKIK